MLRREGRKKKKKESSVYQRWISVEKEKAGRFIWQRLTFGVYQQAAFYSTKDKRGESELFKYCMRCYDTVQSTARQEIKLHVCSTRGRAQRGRINGRLALGFFFR